MFWTTPTDLLLPLELELLELPATRHFPMFWISPSMVGPSGDGGGMVLGTSAGAVAPALREEAGPNQRL